MRKGQSACAQKKRGGGVLKESRVTEIPLGSNGSLHKNVLTGPRNPTRSSGIGNYLAASRERVTGTTELVFSSINREWVEP